MKKILSIVFIFLVLFSFSCANNQKESITMANPELGSVISLCNDEVVNFITDYYPFEDHQRFINKTESEHYYPASVKFNWVDSESQGPYILYVSLNEDMTDSMVFETVSNCVTVDNLLTGKKYFYKIENKANSKCTSIFYFTTKNQPRTIEIRDVSNTRDIGGYQAGEYFVKQQMVYRGGCLDSIGALGKAQFNKLGIKTIIDLREEQYRIQLFNNVNYPNLPESGCGCYTTGTMSIKEDKYKQAVADAVKIFADENNYPIYFHCQIGRDRTGTLAFILNGLLGVTYEDLCLDYELSILSKSGCGDYEDKDKQLTNMKGGMSGLYSYFVGYSKYKGAEEPSLKNGIECYLIDNGVTIQEIQKIKEILLEK